MGFASWSPLLKGKGEELEVTKVWPTLLLLFRLRNHIRNVFCFKTYQVKVGTMKTKAQVKSRFTTSSVIAVLGQLVGTDGRMSKLLPKADGVPFPWYSLWSICYVLSKLIIKSLVEPRVRPHSRGNEALFRAGAWAQSIVV